MFKKMRFLYNFNLRIDELGIPAASIPRELDGLINLAATNRDLNPCELAIVVAARISGSMMRVNDDVIIGWKKDGSINTFKEPVSEALPLLGHSMFSHVAPFD